MNRGRRSGARSNAGFSRSVSHRSWCSRQRFGSLMGAILEAGPMRPQPDDYG
jgi:hypothetical protein